jgi:hypothetical protein
MSKQKNCTHNSRDHHRCPHKVQPFASINNSHCAAPYFGNAGQLMQVQDSIWSSGLKGRTCPMLAVSSFGGFDTVILNLWAMTVFGTVNQ